MSLGQLDEERLLLDKASDGFELAEPPLRVPDWRLRGLVFREEFLVLSTSQLCQEIDDSHDAGVCIRKKIVQGGQQSADHVAYDLKLSF